MRPLRTGGQRIRVGLMGHLLVKGEEQWPFDVAHVGGENLKYAVRLLQGTASSQKGWFFESLPTLQCIGSHRPLCL